LNNLISSSSAFVEEGGDNWKLVFMDRRNKELVFMDRGNWLVFTLGLETSLIGGSSHIELLAFRKNPVRRSHC
jgi:hypothetical protein